MLHQNIYLEHIYIYIYIFLTYKGHNIHKVRPGAVFKTVDFDK